MVRIARNLLFALGLAAGVVACSEQDTVPLDLDGTIPLVDPPAHSDAGNEEAREQGQQLAEQQCLDDPQLAEGVVKIVQPETDFVVAEIVVDCSEVR